MRNDEDYVNCEVEYKAHTDAAVLVTQHNNEVWVPRSCLTWSTDRGVEKLSRGEVWQMCVVRWFAMKTDLDGD
jgi:hypothetical protein